MTVTDKRTSGRTSAARVPSARATITTSCSAARPAITCTTRGSLARARRSTFSSSATFCVLSSVPIGSVGAYSTCAGATLRHAADLDAAALARGCDRAHRARGVLQRRVGDVVAVGKRRLLAGHRAHADALVDREAAALDDAFFQAPAFVARALEIQVGVVDAVLGDRRQRRGQGGARSGRRARAAVIRRRPSVRGWVHVRSCNPF